MQTATGPDLQPERQLRPGQADRARRQAARHERQPDVRVRPRPRHRQAQPDDAHRRPLGGGPEGDRDRLVEREERPLRRRRHDRRVRAGPDPALPHRRDREVRLGRLARRRDDRDLRHEDGAALLGKYGLRPDRGLGEAGRLAATARPRDPAAPAGAAPRSRPGRSRRRRARRTSRSSRSSSSTSCSPSGRSRCSSARSSSSTRSRSPSPSGPASWRRCGRSAPPAGRCAARCWSRASRSACSPRALGLALGVGLAKGLGALMAALSLDLPQTGTGVRDEDGRRLDDARHRSSPCSPAIAPAIKATKVPPIAAVREGATLPPGRLAPYRTAVALCRSIGLSLALLGYGLFVERRRHRRRGSCRWRSACSGCSSASR